MKGTVLTKLSDRYLAALRSHVRPASQARTQTTQQLGSQAVALGLETLGLARMHAQALATLVPADCTDGERDEMTRQASVFFSEVAVPIEKTHRFALEAGAELKRLNVKLEQLTKDMADSRRNVQLQIAARKTTEATLKSTKQSSSQLLKESRRLEKHLQKMTHDILSANEGERKKMSHQLQDEIAQTLLGIHVRLLALKTEASANHADLTKEIAATQQLVEVSVKTINRLAREYGAQHED
jgi:signal transduction histidine kinase